VEGRGGRGRSGDLFLGEIVSIFPKNIYIYIGNKLKIRHTPPWSRESGKGGREGFKII
jgi:hypothetical protein